MTVMVAAASPSIAGFLAQYVEQFFDYANQASASLSAHLISHEALAILAACVMIRILYVAIPAMLEGDLSSLAADVTSLVVTVFIILTLFAVWNGSGTSRVGRPADGNVLHIVPSAGLSSINIRCETKKALAGLTNDVVDAIPAMAKSKETSVTVPPYVCGNKGGGVASAVQMAASAFGRTTMSLIHATVSMLKVNLATGGNVFDKAILNGLGKLEVFAVVIPIMLIVLAVLVVVFVVLLLDIIMAWAHIIIPLTFGPVVIAFYPINPQWTRNVVSSIAAGLISYATTLFVMLIVVSVFIGAAHQVVTDMTHPSGMTWVNFAGSALGQFVPLAFIGVLFAYAGNGFVSAAMTLVSGSDHFSRHRGQTQGSVTGGVKKGVQKYMSGGLKRG